LTGSLPPGPFDLIMCRNVMIYFNSQLQLQLIKRFHERLAPGGFLVLGKTEVLLSERRHLFKVINLSERIYQRQDAAPETDTVQ
jgi:chemotaxis methyl-accepting protein methylase